MDRIPSRIVLSVAMAASCLSLAGCGAMQTEATSTELTDTTPAGGAPIAPDGRRATLLSAFFGLDNGLFQVANLICNGAAGKDGMPVIFSAEIDHTTMQAGDFKVVTESGKTGKMHCVSLLPATDAGELRTVLLIGEFGNADSDPPARVKVVGNLFSMDGALNFRGASIAVTPLAPGPSLVMAERVSDKEVDKGIGLPRTKGTACPGKGTVQQIRVVWAGGVTLPNGDEPGDAERRQYKITVAGVDGKTREVIPAALANLGDGDNNHVLCLDTADQALSVSFPGGILQDPNGDLNPPTSVEVGG
ncbi:hypothetical protein [Sphingomonas sp.]